ncbi:hypothetical protein H0H81_001118 [Sphagnurus paluster]|uniref:Uncharacterized protein n=1 Tax=Sphagnurus paluster TaxID=117069 RepID=A0A9P7GIM9_9AGAR|nr:hypothetical protein H0H81_001118 [Sphagnurus paluster]
MSLRTFTIFQDEPPVNTPKSTTPAATSPTLSNRSVNINHATTVTTTEKENVHPLTGERPGPTANNPKKRKTSVLATKVHMPLATKKQKESKESVESNPDAKKRKSSSSTSTAKAKTAVKKDGRTTTVSKKSVKKPSRKVSSLPKVEEEVERINQAEIDSRCYDLTVKPLADLSQAYEQSTATEAPSVEEKAKFASVKEASVEPEIRDYFSPPPQSSVLLPSAVSAGADAAKGRAFSTPERKQIYAAFTFTSPSPTTQRYNKATRATSVPRLELV